MLVPCRVTNIPMINQKSRGMVTILRVVKDLQEGKSPSIYIYIFSVGRLPNLVLNAPINMAHLGSPYIAATSHNFCISRSHTSH